ncbi:MAG: histidine kinase [Spirochaetales bacterium]|nr:histidine kinase [Spirochaetales bacterium]
MKIRFKLVLMAFIYISCIATISLMAISSRFRADEIQASLDLGVELQLRSRDVQSHMKDIVFDLFAPKVYNQLRSLTFSPRSAVTLTQWKEALRDYNRTFEQFMELDHFYKSGDSLIRDQYLTALTMNERANEMLSHMEETLILLRSRYRTVDNLYNQMQKDESLIPFFTEFQETSYYFKNSFESFMNYFIGSLKEEGARIQQELNIVLIVSIILTLILAVLFTLLLSRDLVSKLRIVEGSLRQVAKGNFSVKVNIRSNDEFGEFSSTLNELLAELKENVNSILNLTRDIGGTISDNSDIRDLYGIVATAVVEDTSADSVLILRSDRETGYTIEAEKGQPLDENEKEKILYHFSIKVFRRQNHVLLEKAADTLGCPGIRTLFAVPLTMDGKSFGYLVSMKRGRNEPFSDLGITRLATFAEYASLTINNYFQLQELLEIRDARYQALQAQVQPHFLYNILGVILGLNRTGEQEKITETVTALKNMLRYIQSQNNWTSLEEECQFIEQYCLLQKIRFGKRFDYKITVDEISRHIQIPRLLLQPLVENSVLHGIEPLEKNGMLELSCEGIRFHGENSSSITIRDNGIGFDSAEMDKKSNIGLINVQQRLKIAFPESVFQMESAIGEGTVVRISL